MAYTSVQLKGSVRQALAERYQAVDGRLLRRLTEAGLNWLRANQESLNALNVFPVPDGDTGTNMVLTMQSAWDEVLLLEERNLGKVAHAIAHGALMGARGNSGVILSQLWRGFARAVDDLSEVDAARIVAALEEARETAYRGVVRPVEGTILTVSKDVAAAARTALNDGADSTLEILEIVVAAADESVKRTPDLLPILKEAGVVDAGGKGLFFLLEGMLRAAYRQPLDQAEVHIMPLSSLVLQESSELIEPGQDWEVIVDFQPGAELDLPSFYNRLESMGTSIQVGEGEGMYRVHIHVPKETEYEPIEYVKSLGTVTQVKLENLMSQMAAREAADLEAELNENIDVVDRALQQVRDLSLDLRPSLLDDLGLVPALRWYADRMARRAGFEARLDLADFEPRLPPEVETACFRIAQEALTNIARHAQARQVRLSLDVIDGEVHLVIADNGAGFDVRPAREQATRQGTSMGLLGMEERAMLAGGRIEIESAPGQGAEVRVTFPLP